MGLAWEQIVVDAVEPVVLGRWWSEALGWVVVNDHPDEFEIRPASDGLPGLIFEPVRQRKQTKNRLHLDLRPDDQDAEVARLLALGASRVLDGYFRAVIVGDDGVIINQGRKQRFFRGNTRVAAQLQAGLDNLTR